MLLSLFEDRHYQICTRDNQPGVTRTISERTAPTHDLRHTAKESNPIPRPLFDAFHDGLHYVCCSFADPGVCIRSGCCEQRPLLNRPCFSRSGEDRIHRNPTLRHIPSLMRNTATSDDLPVGNRNRRATSTQYGKGGIWTAAYPGSLEAIDCF